MTSIFSSALSQWQDGRDYMYCDLVDAVKSVHQQSFRTAVKAVNRYATMRNWLIGFFIVEYQQKGKDRAAYGENLLKSLQVGNLFMIKIQPTPSVKSVAEEIQPTASAKLQSDAETVVGKLSFSHLCELIHIGDETTRLFYETECVKCGWSVRELRRFIATNLHIRVGMSQNPNAVIASLPSNNNMSALDIRQPYTFEFLGLKATEVLKESDIEEALLSHLQQFLLEMGKGFCFEDRHEHLGQLNAYVSYYKENEMHDGDNPPVGILLCTKAGKKMVEYALAGMDNNLFVSTYLLQLPDKSVLEKFIKDNKG